MESKTTCFLWFHKWLRWSEPETINVIEEYQTLGSVKVLLQKPREFTEERQRRSCYRCGKVEERVV